MYVSKDLGPASKTKENGGVKGQDARRRSSVWLKRLFAESGAGNSMAVAVPGSRLTQFRKVKVHRFEFSLPGLDQFFEHLLLITVSRHSDTLYILLQLRFSYIRR